jgi:hypothetical protein
MVTLLGSKYWIAYYFYGGNWFSELHLLHPGNATLHSTAVVIKKKLTW